MAERKRVPGLAVVLGFGKGKKPESDSGAEDESVETDDLSPGAEAMSDLADALRAKDYQGAFDALERAMAHCDKSYESEDPESEDY